MESHRDNVLSEFKVGDEIWGFTTPAELYGGIYWPFIQLKKRCVMHAYEEQSEYQEFYFKTKNEAIAAMVAYIEGMRDD